MHLTTSGRIARKGNFGAFLAALGRETFSRYQADTSRRASVGIARKGMGFEGIY